MLQHADENHMLCDVKSSEKDGKLWKYVEEILDNVKKNVDSSH